ncbi:hypothetical protein H104_08774 [Trichophyton rubrum CBS 289.86]|nr:hypothetical protein H104_08774 [Trichophyton rubrum CBS 289.86]
MECSSVDGVTSVCSASLHVPYISRIPLSQAPGRRHAISHDTGLLRYPIPRQLTSLSNIRCSYPNEGHHYLLSFSEPSAARRWYALQCLLQHLQTSQGTGPLRSAPIHCCLRSHGLGHQEERVSHVQAWSSCPR